MTELAYIHLSAAHRELLTHAEKLAADTLAQVAAVGEPGVLNRPLLRALARCGLLGRVFPAGAEAQHSRAHAPRVRPEGPNPPGVAAMDLCLIREGLARFCTEAETALAVQGLGGYPILRSGRPDVVDAWLPRIAAGEAVTGFALTEPEAGSDAASLATSAERDGDGFRLTGEKVFISNAPDADVYSVFARTTPGAGARGVTAFAVPRDSDGFDGDRMRLVSPHPIGRLRFRGVFVPRSHVLGEIDRGWEVAMQTLNLFRPSVGAFAVGMAQAALDAAVTHATTREAFGRPLRDFQAISHQLADVATRLHAARLLVHSAAAAYDAGAGETAQLAQLAAMAKLFATETAQVAVDVAIQVHGARALEEGHLLEHLYREVRAPRIYEGTSEIQREIIARRLFRR